ncbi:hypothetical protein GCM10011609_87550 [Lentzea pudingi]|uniref:Resolvase/invertase-type recombinase catalytic domain-containing protein n=1 Tax=Lentzea pudingi TaxID=1789439 RepID=A0ABQ2IXA2_9PSEU|nr:hypothetical protein GCM10011609_87550 [Lentzea pudingi]
MFIEEVSGKLSSRPKLDTMLERLRTGDEVVVIRLKRIGRFQQHLLKLVRWFGATTSTSSCWNKASTPPAPAGGWCSTSSRHWPSTTER